MTLFRVFQFCAFFLHLAGLYGPLIDEPDLKQTLHAVGGNYVEPSEAEQKMVPHEWKETRARRSVLTSTGTVPGEYAKTFLPGKKWRTCDANINTFPHQGECGICHSVNSASVMSNRRCIALEEGWLNYLPENQRGHPDDQISAFHVAACHVYGEAAEPSDEERCTKGSNQLRVFRHGVFSGYVTGTKYSTKWGPDNGCLPFPFSARLKAPLALKCPTKDSATPACSNKDNYKTNYENDFRFIDTYWSTKIDYTPNSKDAKLDIVERMKWELYTYGPMVAAVAFPDINGMFPIKIITQDHKMAKDVIKQVLDKTSRFNHVVRIIGYDICLDEQDKPIVPEIICWLVANSWSQYAHRGGILMIEVGHNLMRIEESLSAPVVAIRDDPCKSEDFQGKAITASAWIKDGLYLIQGKCAQRVGLKDGKELKPEGPPEFTQRVFVGAPPYVNHVVYMLSDVAPGKQEIVPNLLDTRGEGVAIFARGTGASVTPVKYLCSYRKLDADSKALEQEMAARWVDAGATRFYSLKTFLATTLIPESSTFRPDKVNTMLYMGAGTVAIFGQDQENNFIAGLVAIGSANGGTGMSRWIQAPKSQAAVLKPETPSPPAVAPAGDENKEPNKRKELTSSGEKKTEEKVVDANKKLKSDEVVKPAVDAQKPVKAN